MRYATDKRNAPSTLRTSSAVTACTSSITCAGVSSAPRRRHPRYQFSAACKLSPTLMSAFFKARFVSSSSRGSMGPVHSLSSYAKIACCAASQFACSTPLSTHSMPVEAV